MLLWRLEGKKLISMKLNENLVNHYGSLITIAFMAGSDGKEDSYHYSEIELEYCNIIMDIKKGEKYVESYFSQHMIELYMSSFEAEISAYQILNTPLPAIVEKLATIVRDNSNSSERLYCKQTLDNFAKKMAIAFDRPTLPYILSKASNIIGK